MQMPDRRTPTTVCLRLSAFHRLVLGRFTQHQRLATRVDQAERQLRTAQDTFLAALEALVEPRAKVHVIDYFSDQRVTLLHLGAKTADSGRDGPTVEALFPQGKTVVVEPIGKAQVDEVRKLEARLAALGGALAAEHLQPLQNLRTEYEAALADRNTRLTDLGGKRQLRDAAKRVWLDAYAANQGAVKESYPRDRRLQDLFFDDFRASRRVAAEDGEDEEPDGTEEPA